MQQFLTAHCAKKIRSIACLLLWVGLALQVQAQNPQDSLQLLLDISVNARYAAADHLGNVYAITQTNDIEKYSPAGKFMTRYSNNRLGSAERLDVSNPLKMIVWYPDFKTALLLDRSLTELGEINLIDAGFPELRTLALARDGMLWLYDEPSFRLRKINIDGQAIRESQPLNLLIDDRLHIGCLYDDGHVVIAADTGRQLIVFDAFGQLINRQLIPGLTSFSVSEGRIYWTDGVCLYTKPIQEPNISRLLLPAAARQNSAQRWISPAGVFIQSGTRLQWYTVKS